MLEGDRRMTDIMRAQYKELDLKKGKIMFDLLTTEAHKLELTTLLPRVPKGEGNIKQEIDRDIITMRIDDVDKTLVELRASLDAAQEEILNWYSDLKPRELIYG